MDSSEVNYWNQNSYGDAYRIRKGYLHAVNLILGAVIPIVYPVPLAVLINRYVIQKDMVIRYERN